MNYNEFSKAGIYKLTNKFNGKIYIGKSINFKRRFDSHRNDKRGKNLISKAIKKYGWENFKIDIIFSSSNIIDNNILLFLETSCIYEFNSYNRKIGYNICLYSTDKSGIPMSKKQRKLLSNQRKGKNKGKENCFYGKHHTKETKEKLKKSWEEKYKNGYISPNKGKCMSKQSINKRNKTIQENGTYKGKNNPMFGKPNRDENIYKFKNIVTDEIFEGTRYDFYTKYNLLNSNICLLIKNKQKKHKNWILI